MSFRDNNLARRGVRRFMHETTGQLPMWQNIVFTYRIGRNTQSVLCYHKSCGYIIFPIYYAFFDNTPSMTVRKSIFRPVKNDYIDLMKARTSRIIINFITANVKQINNKIRRKHVLISNYEFNFPYLHFCYQFRWGFFMLLKLLVFFKFHTREIVSVCRVRQQMHRRDVNVGRFIFKTKTLFNS